MYVYEEIRRNVKEKLDNLVNKGYIKIVDRSLWKLLCIYFTLSKVMIFEWSMTDQN